MAVPLLNRLQFTFRKQVTIIAIIIKIQFSDTVMWRSSQCVCAGLLSSYHNTYYMFEVFFLVLAMKFFKP